MSNPGTADVVADWRMTEMKFLSQLLMALLLSLTMALYSCAPPSEEPDPEGSLPGQCDDDEDNDGDGDTDCDDSDCDNDGDCEDGDDDDDDDGDFVVEGFTFEVQLTVTVSGDDDDSASGDDDSASGDDDDSATGDDDDDDDGGNYVVSVDYVMEYFSDFDNNVTQCLQILRGTGVANFNSGGSAAPGCTNCTGYINFDPATFEDVSDFANNPQFCDPAALDALGKNAGAALVAPLSDTALGDFLQMGLIDTGSLDFLDLSVTLDGSQTAADLIEVWEANAGVSTHVGLVEAVEGSLGANMSLASEIHGGTGDAWYGWWSLARDPKINQYEGIEMDGFYFGYSFWKFQYTQ